MEPVTFPTPSNEQIAALKQAASVFYTLREQVEAPFLAAIDPKQFTSETGMDNTAYVERLRLVRDIADQPQFFVDIEAGGDASWRVELMSGIVFETRRRLRAMHQDPDA